MNEKIKYDKATEKWFKEHPLAESTVCQCKVCGLWYKGSLGHSCKKAKMKDKEKALYLKFKPMADDLRLAESWCEQDGVLNRNRTAQNLYEMGYRRQSGNLMELPCKIGDNVYCIVAKSGLSGGLIHTGHIVKRKVDKLIYDGVRWEMMSDRVYPDWKDDNHLIYAHFGDLVFVSEDEAKSRLKEILDIGAKMKGGAE